MSARRRPSPGRTPELTAAAPYTVELVDATGAVLIRHTEGEYNSVSSAEVTVGPQTAFRIPPAAQRSEADISALGEEQELDRGAARRRRHVQRGWTRSFP